MNLLANRYLLEAKIGEGGQAEVWAARDEWSGGQKVAIKKLSANSAALLEHEFTRLQQLRHPNVVRALDFVVVESTSYLVQERINGLTLSQWSKENSPEALLELVGPIAHALAHLHARGWVHFDATAANILVDEEHTKASLLDLGLVQPAGAQVIGGTPGYIAPELFEGKPVTGKADVYTFAKSIWDLLVARDSSFVERPDVAAIMKPALDSNPLNRPGAYRFAKQMISLVDGADDGFLYRPLTCLPLCGRAGELAKFRAWHRKPASAFVIGGARGNGLSAFLESCVEELKLRGYHILSVSGNCDDPLDDILLQAVSLAPKNGAWIDTHKATLAALVSHPRLLGMPSQRVSKKERAPILAILLEELATEIPLSLVIDDVETGSNATSWGAFVGLLQARGVGNSLRVILNVGDSEETIEHRLSPLLIKHVEQFLTLAFGYLPTEAETNYLMELTSGRPKLLQAAVRCIAQTDKTILEVRVEDLSSLGEIVYPEALEPLRLLSGAIPREVIVEVLKLKGCEGNLGGWVHEGFLLALGKGQFDALCVPRIFQKQLGSSKCYRQLSEAYSNAGFELNAQLLLLKDDKAQCSKSQVDKLIALSPACTLPEMLTQLYHKFGIDIFRSSHLHKLADESSFMGDVAGVELAISLLGEGQSSLWAAAKLGAALNRVGHFENSMELNKAHLKNMDCASVYAAALLASGKPTEAIDLAGRAPGTWNAAMAHTVGSALCQTGAVDRGVEALREAISLAKADDDGTLLGRAWHGLAIAYQRSSRFEKALEAYQRAIEFSNPVTYVSRSLNLGTLLQDMGSWDEAERRYRESLSRAIIAGNVREQSQCGVNLSNLLILSGQIEQGARLAEWTASVCESNNLFFAQAMALLVLAESYLERSDAAGAMSALEQARRLFDEISDPNAVAEWRLLDARAALLSNRFVSANRTFFNLKKENVYPELAWRVMAWWIHGQLLQEKVIEQEDIGRLEDLLRETQREKNIRFEWKLLALLTEVQKRSGIKEALLTQALARKRMREWKTVMASQERLSYFDTYFRGVLLSYLDEANPGALPSSKMEPNLSFVQQLVAINRRLAREHDLDNLLELIVDAAIDLVGAERGFILLRANDAVSVAVARNLEKQTINEGSHGISRSIAMEVLSTGDRVLTTNALEDSRFSHAKSVSAFKLRSVLCLPLRANRRGEDQLIGSLYLDHRFQERAFSESEMTLCAALADQASIAMENARLFSEIRAQEAALEVQNKQLAGLNSKLQQDVARYANQAENALRRLREEGPSVGVGEGFERFVGSSTPLKEALRLVERFADTDVPVLICGESGTGKELVARAFHERSRRKKRGFVSINCGAIPAELIESELFGYTKGAFTGAIRDKKGLIGEAEGGTLFLDEIGEMPLPMQVKLLRVLQEGEYRPVGGRHTLTCDIRVLSATHQDLIKLIENGTFREDFYYRIQVVEVPLPALRQRREDIPALAEHFCEKFAGRSLKQCFDEEALGAMLAYDWPGNIRELENEVRRCLALSDGVAGIVELSEKLQKLKQDRRHTLIQNSRGSLREIMNGFEKHVLVAALERNNWNVKKTADELGLSRASFYTRLNKFEIKR